MTLREQTLKPGDRVRVVLQGSTHNGETATIEDAFPAFCRVRLDKGGTRELYGWNAVESLEKTDSTN